MICCGRTLAGWVIVGRKSLMAMSSLGCTSGSTCCSLGFDPTDGFAFFGVPVTGSQSNPVK